MLRIVHQNAARRLARWTGLLLALAYAQASAADDVRVAVATNFKSTLEVLAAEFESQSGHGLIISSGSTGKLYAQIRNGAPFDVFLSADDRAPQLLVGHGLAVEGSVFTYAQGRLALWSPDAAKLDAQTLQQGEFQHIAIANPQLAPYGAAARDVIEALGVADQLEDKLVFGENIGQTFAFVHAGAADLGFVAMSQILSREESERGNWWEPPQEAYTPIRQDAVLLERAAENDAAKAFVIYLQSGDAQDLIEQSGYARP